MKSFAVFAIAVLLAPTALAQHEAFIINPTSSKVSITLKTTHEDVTGNFHIQSGSIGFDRNSLKMSGSVLVFAGSGQTGNTSRDKKMDKDILQIDQHQLISFEPKSYAGTLVAERDSTILVAGVFTLLGTPHEITIPMLVHLEGTTATVKAHFVVPYIQWGLKDPGFLFWKADSNVGIDLFLTGYLSK